MPYAAVIAVTPGAAGADNLLKDVAPFFADSIAKFRKREGEWLLVSSSFDNCDSAEKFYDAAKELLSKIQIILSLYIGWYDSPLYISSLVNLTDDDKIIARNGYGYPLKITVVWPAKEAFISTSLATDLLATTDLAITEALSLFGEERLTWSRIYDIIEFLGGVRSLSKLGLAPSSAISRVRQTANYHRHLGNPRKHLLPENPPTLAEASRFAEGLLKQWIATRV